MKRDLEKLFKKKLLREKLLLDKKSFMKKFQKLEKLLLLSNLKSLIRLHVIVDVSAIEPKSLMLTVPNMKLNQNMNHHIIYIVTVIIKITLNLITLRM